MAFANSNVSDLIAAGIESRTGEIADNVLGNNALLAQLRKKGRVKTVSGGTSILQELSFNTNANGGWYSGADLLPVGAQDVISAASFQFKQYAVPVVVTGLELLQNSGKERTIDLVEARLEVAESTMMNDINTGCYSDGTGSSGKQITGLNAVVPTTAKASQSDTYGGISRSTWAFWRTSTTTGQDISSATKCQTVMNTQWATQVRGSDRPDLIIMDQLYWADYMASLQAIQRFSDPASADLGFPVVKFITADVVLDPTSGLGVNATGATTKTAYFLNTKYLHFRPHKDRYFVPLSPNKRYALNQDVECQILAFAGNLTCSGAQFQGRSIATTT
ncbi:MAG TPA: phage major capsid protein [Spirochaetia bacterium]|nr:phage major capsid protein [Spirochaetia bacterium]